MSGKIALALGDYANNYGTVLQAFATYQKVSDLGYDAEAIDFTNLKKSIRNRKLRYFAGKIFDASVIREKGALALKKFHKLIHPGFKNGNSRRDKLFTQFRKKIKRSRRFQSWEDLTNSCCEYSAVLVGSDQVWLPSQIAGDFFTLNFVPDDVKRISYASSFGVSYYEKAQAEKARYFLSRINYLSVREQSGQEIIKQLTGRDAELVCDPTVLLTADEWDSICVNSNYTQQGGARNYVLCYFLGLNKWHRDFARKFADTTGLKLIALPHLDHYTPYDEGYSDELLYDVSPEDFIKLIKNARYVLTDSFHGTMFSLIYSKEFFTFRRFRSNTSSSTNTRIESIAARLGIQDRLVNETDAPDSLLSRKLDVQALQQRLADFRDSSLAFLTHALEAQS